MSYLLSTGNFFAHSENLHCTEAENPDMIRMAAMGAGGGQHPKSVLSSWDVVAAPEPRPSCTCRDLEIVFPVQLWCQVQSDVGHGI